MHVPSEVRGALPLQGIACSNTSEKSGCGEKDEAEQPVWMDRLLCIPVRMFVCHSIDGVIDVDEVEKGEEISLFDMKFRKFMVAGVLRFIAMQGFCEGMQ